MSASTVTLKNLIRNPASCNSDHWLWQHATIQPMVGTTHIQVQPELKISQPDDEYEREADRVADTVMRMPQPQQDENEQRSELGRSQQVLQPQATNVALLPGEAPSMVHDVSLPSGRPLDVNTSAPVTQRFGYDFSQVRVHTDDRASRPTGAVNAMAYTLGNNITFQKGQYVPATVGDKNLLIHERTRPVQQNRTKLKQAPVSVLQRTISAQPDVTLDNYFRGKSISNVLSIGSKYIHPGSTESDLDAQILVDMLRSPREFRVEGSTESTSEMSLQEHVDARKGIIGFAGKKKYKFESGSASRMNPDYWDLKKGRPQLNPGVDPMTAINDINVHPSEYEVSCDTAALLTYQGGSGEADIGVDLGVDRSDWIPGDMGYIQNTKFSGGSATAIAGQNILYVGYNRFWGHVPTRDPCEVVYKTLDEWIGVVESWSGINPWSRSSGKVGRVQDWRVRPTRGLL